MSRVAVKCHQASNSTVTSANQSAAAAALTGSRRLTYIILSQLSLDLYTLIPQTKVIRGSPSKVIGWFKGKLIFFMVCLRFLIQNVWKDQLISLIWAPYSLIHVSKYCPDQENSEIFEDWDLAVSCLCYHHPAAMCSEHTGITQNFCLILV